MKYLAVFGLVAILSGCDVGYVTDPERMIKHINDCEAIGKVPKIKFAESGGSAILPFGCGEKVRSNQ